MADPARAILRFTLPLAEIIVDFHDQVKRITSGYGRWVRAPGRAAARVRVQL